MANPKPLVQAACVCEKVLTESDRVASLIRIVDNLYITKPANAKPADVGRLDISVYVALKSGDVTGEYDIELVLRAPSSKPKPFMKWHAVFVGGESGSTVTVNLGIPIKEMGLFWIDVIWEGEVLTKIPFRLLEGQKPERPEDAVKPTPAEG